MAAQCLLGAAVVGSLHVGEHVLHIVVLFHSLNECLHVGLLLGGEFLVIGRLIDKFRAFDFKAVVLQILLDVAIGLESARDEQFFLVLVEVLGSAVDQFQLQVIELDAVLGRDVEIAFVREHERHGARVAQRLRRLATVRVVLSVAVSTSTAIPWGANPS